MSHATSFPLLTADAAEFSLVIRNQSQLSRDGLRGDEGVEWTDPAQFRCNRAPQRDRHLGERHGRTDDKDDERGNGGRDRADLLRECNSRCANAAMVARCADCARGAQASKRRGFP